MASYKARCLRIAFLVGLAAIAAGVYLRERPWASDGRPGLPVVVAGDAAVAGDLVIRLADRFAPIAFYAADEPDLPTSVDRFLPGAELWFFGKSCRPQQERFAILQGTEIPVAEHSSCGRGPDIHSDGSRSFDKESTFYLLKNAASAGPSGSRDSADWVTYIHAYRNDQGGVTLQFWRFYAHNTGYFAGVRLSGGSHGGDWEAIHVVLGAGPEFAPLEVRLLGHVDITTVPWAKVPHQNGHALIRCAKGSHTSQFMTRSDIANRKRFIEQESWNGGSVRWPDGRITRSGPLVDVGSKNKPQPGFEWLRYSGLWGARESAGLWTFYRSGYWGPAFNETGMGKDGFISAWCEGMAVAKRGTDDFQKECYPAASAP